MSKSESDVANNTMNCIALAVSLLVIPVSLATLITLSCRCYRERRLREALPLLATQLNSTVIWACLAAYEVGQFNYQINGT